MLIPLNFLIKIVGSIINSSKWHFNFLILVSFATSTSSRGKNTLISFFFWQKPSRRLIGSTLVSESQSTPSTVLNFAEEWRNTSSSFASACRTTFEGSVLLGFLVPLGTADGPAWQGRKAFTHCCFREMRILSYLFVGWSLLGLRFAGRRFEKTDAIC